MTERKPTRDELEKLADGKFEQVVNWLLEHTNVPIKDIGEIASFATNLEIHWQHPDTFPDPRTTEYKD